MQVDGLIDQTRAKIHAVAPILQPTYDMKVRMRLATVIFSFAMGACVCSPSTPQSVTLRLKNTSPAAIYVDQSDGRLGMVVQRNLGGQYTSFVETPACDCQSCDQICSVATCDCPMPAGMVLRVAAGDSVERTWSGVVQISGSAECGGFGTGTTCLSPDNAPYNETFNLHLCYVLQAPGLEFPDDGGSTSGTLDMTSVTCTDKEFHIEDGLAEISPPRGADCVTTADCKGAGELCFSGACTASCPDNGYPSIGQNWNVSVGVDPMDFFDVATDGKGRTVYTGTGTITSAAYSGNSVAIQLGRTGSAGEMLRGTVHLSVPPMQLGPLASGTGVTVKAIGPNMTESQGNGALLIRATDDGGTLLVAVDAAQNGALLSPADVAPLTVTFNTDTIGCTTSSGCGKVLYSTTTFTLAGKSVKLEPGSNANLVDPTGVFRALNVEAQINGAGATCDPADIRSYLIWRDKAPGTP
jgi:hypothetical protein